MATVGTGYLTLADWARRVDPDGTTADIAEVLTKANPVLEDAIWLEGNLPTGHRSTQRASLPTGTYRLLNQGVAKEVSTTTQVTDTIGMLESYSEVDKALADLNGNTAAFRWSEDIAFIEGMGQTTASTIFYGNTNTDPEKFMGLAPRYNDIDSIYCLDANGATATCRSIWLVTWDPNTCFMFFPKDSTAGLKAEDKGQVTLEDTTGNQYEGYRTHYMQYCGLAVRDYRYVIRCCNIDYEAIATPTEAYLVRKMIEMYNLLPSKKGKQVFYMGRQVRTWLDIHREEKTNLGLSMIEWAGEPTLAFWGIPIRICEALDTDEAEVTS